MAFLSMMPSLYVSDVERAAAFYRDLLGGAETFRVPARWARAACGAADRLRHARAERGHRGPRAGTADAHPRPPA